MAVPKKFKSKIINNKYLIYIAITLKFAVTKMLISLLFATCNQRRMNSL